MTESKPQIHWSKIRSRLRCGEAFRRAERGEFIPPTTALIKGSSTHKGNELDLKYKMDTGHLLPLEQLQDVTRDATNNIWDEQGARLRPAEKEAGAKKTRGATVDGAVRLVTAYHIRVAPTLSPQHIERAWVCELEGYPFDVAGTIDYDEGDLIIDWKTAKASPRPYRAARSIQLSMYAMAKQAIDKTETVRVALHHMVDLKRETKIDIQQDIRTRRHTRTLLNFIENFIEAEQKGIYLPTDPENWWCDPDYCGYWDTCKYTNH